MENETERQKAYGLFIEAVQNALATIPETAKENLEDLYSNYQGAIEAEGFEYEEGWEFPDWNKPEFKTYKEGEGWPSWNVGETVCVNEPHEGLAFLSNVLVCAMPKRTEAAFESFGEALRDFVQAPEGPEAEAKLSEAVTENKTALDRAGFSVFVPEGKGFKEVK